MSCHRTPGIPRWTVMCYLALDQIFKVSGLRLVLNNFNLLRVIPSIPACQYYET